MTLPVEAPPPDLPDELLTFAGPNASPVELFQLGRQVLADSWQMARTYFRAAVNLALDQSEAWTNRRWQAVKRFCLAPLIPFLDAIESNPLRWSLWAEFIRAWHQIAAIAAPYRPAFVWLVHPLRVVDMSYWLACLLMVDVLLWGGLVGLFGLSTVEGSAAPLAAHSGGPKTARRASAIVPPQATLVPTPAPSLMPTATPIVLTATPIPFALSVWEPTLPLEIGWSGTETCSGQFIAPVGSGAFRWPTDKHYLSGYDYSRWHLGLDISVLSGDSIYAADAGVVVYAGWNAWGYGNTVIIDHGNGWHTLYAHLSQVNVSCGQAVEQGAVIGLAGSTGHSTGPHLHFEMRTGNGRVNPWWYLP